MTTKFMAARLLIVSVMIAAVGYANGHGSRVDNYYHDEQGIFSYFMRQYERIRKELLENSVDDLSRRADRISRHAKRLQKRFTIADSGVLVDDEEECRRLLAQIEEAATSLASAESLPAARAAFLELSQPLRRYADLVVEPWPRVAACPLTNNIWLQSRGSLQCPYHGEGSSDHGEALVD